MHVAPFFSSDRDYAGGRRGRRLGPARHWTWRLAGVALATLALMAGALTADTTGASAAQTDFGPPDLINLAALTVPVINPTAIGAASGLYSATPAQITSLENLEATAVSDTVSDHSLDGGDSNAVLSWARSDADAELWALFVQAIQAVKAGTATTDQTNAVAWLTAVSQREGVLSARDAGLQYTKWAGLGISNWNNLISSNNGNPSQAALTSFLSGTPVQYTDGGSATNPGASADGGYCVYIPPSPDQGQYTSSIFGNTPDQTCFTPCTNVFGCNLPTPSLQNFEDWGAADVGQALFNNPGFATATQNVAESASMGAAATVGAVATGIGVSLALQGTITGTAFQQAVFPFAARTSALTPAAPAEAAGEAGGETATEAAEGALDAAAEVGGDVAATGVGIIVAAVIFAVITAVQEGLIVFSGVALPGQLAGFITQATTNTPDLTSMLGNSSAMQGLYNLFIASTLPTPTFNSCNNNVLAGLGSVPCDNATAVPSQSNVDPQWIVTPKGSSTSTTQETLTWKDAASGLTTTTFLHGNWFVHTSTINGIQATVQSLRLQYTDWQGNENTAWVFTNDNPPEFLTIPNSSFGPNFVPSTCLSTATCFVTTTIDVVGGDGKDYTASVAPGGIEIPAGFVGAATTTTLTTSAPNPAIVGKPVTFTATPSDIGATGTVTFTAGSTTLCSKAPLVPVVPGGGIGIAQAQASCTATFATAGSTQVTAAYSGGVSQHLVAQPTFDEPSIGQLTIDLVNQVATSTTVAASAASPVVGEPVTYTATVADSPGEPAPTGTVTFTNGGTTVCSAVALSTTSPYTATCSQTYQGVGMQTVSASYSGDTFTLSSAGQAQVTVGQASTSLGLSTSPAAPTFGQPVTFTASVSADAPSIAGPALTGSVTFTLDGQPLATAVPFNGARATSATVYNLAPGPHSVVATYSGDGNYFGSSASSSPTVTCSQTITAASSGPLTVSGSTCVAAGGTVNGPVTVMPGGALALIGGTVNGPVTANGAASVLICGTIVGGPISLTGTVGPIALGGPSGSSCGPDLFNGSVSIDGSNAAVSIEASTIDGRASVSGGSGPLTITGDFITGPLSVTSNSGTVNVSSNTVGGPVTVSSNSSPSAATVSANAITGTLMCELNSVPPTDAGVLNMSSGPATGQCAMLG